MLYLVIACNNIQVQFNHGYVFINSNVCLKHGSQIISLRVDTNSSYSRLTREYFFSNHQLKTSELECLVTEDRGSKIGGQAFTFNRSDYIMALLLFKRTLYLYA